MIRIGAHAFVWIPDWTTELGNEAITAAGRAGFDFLEIPMLKPHEFDAASHRQALANAGIEATVSLVLPKDAHMPFEPEKARIFLTGVLDKMEDTRITYLCGCLAMSLGTLTGAPPTSDEKQRVIDTLGRVAEDAKRRGITLGIEAVNRYESYVLNVLEDGRAIIDAIGADNVELHADTYHMNIEEEGFYAPIVASKGYLGYIHMSESHRGLVGSGNVHWNDVFRGLKDADYTGPLVLESFAAINPDLQAATALWRPPNQPPSVLAKEGIAFLRAGAARVGLGS
jgi:D-psicose/D-tagatose/L-ribulose 3-epimerase